MTFLKMATQAPALRRVVIYGAVTRPEGFSSHIMCLKSHVKNTAATLRDVISWKFGSLKNLDYREYLNTTVVNRGDQAISQAVRKKFQHHSGTQIEFININWGELDTIIDAELAKMIDLIVVAGSGYVFFDTNGKLPQRLRDDSKFFRSVNLPVAFYGIGVNRLLKKNEGDFVVSDDDQVLLRQLLACSSLVSVRDKDSQALLEKYSEKGVVVTGDTALYFTTAQASSRCIWHASRASPIIGINFAFHGAVACERIKRDLPAYIDMLQKLQKRTSCQYRYFVHFEPECIIPRLIAASGIKMEICRGEPDVLSKGYAELNIHIGAMLHSCILSTSVGTPSIALAYDVKHIGFFALMGRERNFHLADDFDVDAVVGSAIKLLESEDAVRETIWERRLALEKIADSFVKNCLALSINKLSIEVENN